MIYKYGIHEYGRRKSPCGLNKYFIVCDVVVLCPPSPFSSLAEVTYSDVALCVSIETEHGLPGPRGLLAAQAAASASRSVSAPAATRPPAMEDECVWARTVKRGIRTRTHTPYTFLHVFWCTNLSNHLHACVERCACETQENNQFCLTICNLHLGSMTLTDFFFPFLPSLLSNFVTAN